MFSPVGDAEGRTVGRSRDWSWDFFGRPTPLSNSARAAFEAFAAERERWALWLPVCLGTGIAVYFALDDEPSIWIGPLCFAAAACIGLAGRRRTAWMLLFAAVGTAALGFTLAQVRTGWVAAPVLEKRTGPVQVAGRLIAEERRVKGRRIVLDHLTIQRISPELVPARIRVTVRKMPIDARPGDRISVRHA